MLARKDKKNYKNKKKSKPTLSLLTLLQQIFLPLLILTTSLILGVIVAVFVFFHFYSDKIYPGISVLGIPLGGKTVKQGILILEKEISPRFPLQLSLHYQDRSFIIPVASIAALANYQATSTVAFALGRQGSILNNLQTISQSLLFGANSSLKIDFSQTTLSQKIANIAAEIDVPVEEPAIQLIKQVGNGTSIVVTSGRNGRSLDTNHTFTQINLRLSHLSSEPIWLKTTEQYVQTSQVELKRAKERAQLLFNKKLDIAAGKINITLAGKELIPFINIGNGFNRGKIASYAATIAPQVNRPAQDALFQFESGRVTSFRLSKEGISLDEETTTAKIIEALSFLEATTSSQLSLFIPVTKTQPKITTGQANNLGIKELLGRGVSFFAGSIPERIHNINLLTSRLNGTLVATGETFSMAATAGDISTATGYKQAYIIKEGRTVLGDGGGTCQPSTTLFRAALNAGLPIVERHQHAYRVSYYEQGGFQPGLDATIFLPQVDLKFKNDTPAYILIQAKVDQAKVEVIFDIYGSKDEREIYISPVRVWDQIPPPPPLYQDDPTLPKGIIKQVDFAAWGTKAAFDYKVTKNGQVIQERTFFSAFHPWQAVYLRGTRE